MYRNTTETWERIDKTWWHWPHFQGHTSTLKSNSDQKKLFCTLSLEPNYGCWPNFMYCIIGVIEKKMIRFWWPWSNFQGHHIIKTVKMSLVCSLSPEPVGGLGGHSLPQKTVFITAIIHNWLTMGQRVNKQWCIRNKEKQPITKEPARMTRLSYHIGDQRSSVELAQSRQSLRYSQRTKNQNWHD